MPQRICKRCFKEYYTPFGYKICLECRHKSKVVVINDYVVHLKVKEEMTFIDYVRLKNDKLADKLKEMLLYAKIS